MIDLQQKLLEEIAKDYKFFVGKNHIELFLKKCNNPNLTENDILISLSDLLSRNLIYIRIPRKFFIIPVPSVAVVHFV